MNHGCPPRVSRPSAGLGMSGRIGKLGHKFLTQRERQREQEAMETWDAIEGWLNGKGGEDNGDAGEES